MSNKGKHEVENQTRLTSDNDFDAGGLRRRVKEVECKRMLEDSKDRELAEEGFSKKIVKSGSRSSVSAARLYRRDALGFL